MNITFTEEETGYALAALRSYRESLRMEIVDTDNSAYKRDLRHEREVLDGVFEKLDHAAQAARPEEAAADQVIGFRLVAIWGPED